MVTAELPPLQVRSRIDILSVPLETPQPSGNLIHPVKNRQRATYAVGQGPVVQVDFHSQQGEAGVQKNSDSQSGGQQRCD
jgi:hypothetical protein